METMETQLCSLDKKSKILQAAKARFLHYGVSKTTTRDIAEDVGISVSNLYLYFENKREIVLAIAEQCRAEQEVIHQQILTDQSISSAEKLEQVLLVKFRCSRSFKTDSPKGTELLAYLLQEYPERAISWQQHLEDMIAAVLLEGTQNGSFHLENVPDAARMMRLSLAQYFLPPYIELPQEPLEDEMVALIRWQVMLIGVKR